MTVTTKCPAAKPPNREAGEGFMEDRSFRGYATMGKTESQYYFIEKQ